MGSILLNKTPNFKRKKGKKESHEINDVEDGIKFFWKNIDSLELTKI